MGRASFEAEADPNDADVLHFFFVFFFSSFSFFCDLIFLRTVQQQASSSHPVAQVSSRSSSPTIVRTNMASLTSSGPALDSSDDSEQTPEQRLQYLRDRGVEVDLPEDRAKATQAAKAGGPQFAYVLLPQVETKAVVELRAHAAPDGASVDVLPQLLAPNFADDGAVLDSAAVEREAAGRLKNMMIGTTKKH